MRLLVVKQLSIELAASLNVGLVFASNELLSVLVSFVRHLMLLFLPVPKKPKGI